MKHTQYTLAQINQHIINVENITEIESERIELAKIAKRDLAFNNVSIELLIYLEKTLEQYSSENESSSKINSILTGVFQADYLIVKLFKKKVYMYC